MRAFAEVLSTDAPVSDLWDRCCATLSELVENESVTIVTRDGGADRVAYVFSGGKGTQPLDRTLPDGAPPLGTLVVPIRFGRTALGAIWLAGATVCDAEHLMLLESCALYAGSRLYHERTTASSEFAQLAFTDGLTGIANRRRFDEALALEWPRAARDGAPLALIMIDLDFFKGFNDNYGHQAGDLCLQRVAHALHDCVARPADLLARYGGEEFVALLPATDLAGATQIAEDMRAGVEALGIVHAGSSLAQLSLSLGVACAVPDSALAADSLLQAADGALYRAKLGGRNRVYARDYESISEHARPRRIAAFNNLPLQLSRTIGRKTEIAQVAGLLGKHRLVSIVGTGGTGKTRTAIEVASEATNRFADGAWFVDLSPVTDASLIASRIAAAFAGEVSLDESATDALAIILESKDMLLVLDNCEHLINDVANLSIALLRHCQKLNILTTSREPLGIAGEAVYRLPLLSMPPAGSGVTPATAIEYDAIALFAERAMEVKRDFALDEANVGLVVEICRAVDGIALAIELAASRVSVIGLAQVAQRLHDFRLLTGGDRTAVPRQRTMYAMIGWSYDLLSEPEQTLLRRLSVFAGSFTFDAVTEICSGPHVEAEDVFDLLTGLIRKSLVADDPDHDDRYRLLDSIRAFAKEKLYDAGEVDLLERRHADYYEVMARQADAMYRRAPSRDWLDALEPDVDNFRVALDWSLDRRGDVVLGAALAAATSNFFNDYMPSEATRWMIRALELLPKGTAPRIEGRLNLLITTSPRDLPAEQMRAAGERAIEIFRANLDRQQLAEALRGTAQIVGWYFRDDRALADELACESIEIARELEDPIQLALSLRTRGLTIDISDIPAKRAVLEESLALMRAHGNDRQIASMLTWVSDLECSAGENRRALEYGREAVAYAQRSGSNEIYATAIINIANYACVLSEWELARQAVNDAIAVSRKTRYHPTLTFALQAYAYIATEFGDPERGAMLLGFCNVRFGTLHPDRQADQSEDMLYRRLLSALREQLDEAKLARATAAGAAMKEDEAIALTRP
ncbi:MAG TPA: diguanylate cyclase [Candidatus Baltobacteraceae bacterium]|nr:diguanylate cyclase [Candidatus Baltobacteraceae bacterium]